MTDPLAPALSPSGVSLRERVQEIRKRAEQATRGPWRIYRCVDEACLSAPHWDVFSPAIVEGQEADHGEAVTSIGASFSDPTVAAEDAKFIAHARSDIPYLLDHLTAHAEALQPEKVVEDVLSHWFTQGGQEQFGALEFDGRSPRNADELVSTLLTILRARAALPPQKELPEQDTLGTWDVVRFTAEEKVRPSDAQNPKPEEPRAASAQQENKITGGTSDGYHTFNELYAYRKVYNALLFNEWARQGLYETHKSRKHSDGDACFGGGWFIVSAQTPEGQITNHYEDEDWPLFQLPERELAAPWDGHTPAIALDRLLKLATTPPISTPPQEEP